MPCDRDWYLLTTQLLSILTNTNYSVSIHASVNVAQEELMLESQEVVLLDCVAGGKGFYSGLTLVDVKAMVSKQCTQPWTWSHLLLCHLLSLSLWSTTICKWENSPSSASPWHQVVTEMNTSDSWRYALSGFILLSAMIHQFMLQVQCTCILTHIHTRKYPQVENKDGVQSDITEEDVSRLLSSCI